MTIDFEDYDGYYIASMIADELPNLYDFIQIKLPTMNIMGE